MLLLLPRTPGGAFADSVPLACTKHPEERKFATLLDKLGALPAGRAMLGNSSVVADYVREAGLARDLRPLYGFGGKAGSEEQWMHARYKFGMLQLPKQVGCMLSELAGLPTRLRTFAEIGAWYGWSGIFFAVYLNRVFASGSAHREVGQDFTSASFDVADMRTPCVKALMAKHKHGFHVNVLGGGPKYTPESNRPGRNKTLTWRPVLAEDHRGAAAWYSQRLREAFGSAGHKASPLDLCFIDASHTFHHVVADVRFFQPRCRFLMFHDIVDADSQGVRQVWHWLSRRLRWERGQLAEERAHGSDSTARAIETGYFVKECTEQAGTRRRNFGLGLISARRLNSSWLDGPPPRHVPRL